MQQTDVPTCAPPVPTARALEAEARRLGYAPGFPPGLSRFARLSDLAAYRRAKCPACRSRMAAVPFHKRDGEGGGYKFVLTCNACGAGEEA